MIFFTIKHLDKESPVITGCSKDITQNTDRIQRIVITGHLIDR